MTASVVDNRGFHEEDRLRANVYGFLARFLLSPPSADMLQETAGLTGDTTELGLAFTTLSKIASKTPVATARQEYNDLFIGVGRGELLPYGSYYLTGFLNEKPLAKLRQSLRELQIQRKEEVKDPEDHIGTLLEVMEGLILGKFGPPACLDDQKNFYRNHIENWASHFFSDLESAKYSTLYQPIG
ncbi:MAG: molecular chaperone TorD family protein, partial [Sneathiella sp.]|nr:molecular chaperone TorD family protein [Sneathiella sp.]